MFEIGLFLGIPQLLKGVTYKNQHIRLQEKNK